MKHHNLQDNQTPPILRLNSHVGYVTSLAFSPDGKTLVSGGNIGELIFWDIESGEIKTALQTSKDDWGPSHLTFSPDGKFIAWDGNPYVALYSTNTQKKLNLRCINIGPFSFSPDSRTLAAASWHEDIDTTIAISDVATGKSIRHFAHDDHNCEQLVFSQCGTLLASTGYLDTQNDQSRYQTTLWNILDGNPTKRIWNQEISLFGWTPGSKTRIVAIATDCSNIWDVETGQLIHAIHPGLRPPAKYAHLPLALSPDRNYLAAAGGKGLCMISLGVGEIWTVSAHDGMIRTIAFTPDGRTLATGGDDHVINLWDVPTGAPLATLGAKKVPLSAARFDSKDETIRIVTRDGRCRVWNLNTGSVGDSIELNLIDNYDDISKLPPAQLSYAKLLYSMEFEHRFTFHIAFSPDGSKAITRHKNELIILWDIARGQAIARYKASDYTHSLVSAFSQDGKTIALMLSSNETISLVESDTGVVIREISTAEPEDYEGISSLAFSPDGSLIVSGHWGFLFNIWDTRTGQRKRRIFPDRDTVCALAFSKDGMTVAEGTAYYEIITLHGLGRGRSKKRLRSHTGDVRDLSYSNNGKWLVSMAEDSTIKVWSAKTDNLLVTLRLLPNEDWIMSTLSSEYCCSKGAERYIRWQTGDIVEASQVISDRMRRQQDNLKTWLSQ